MKKLILILLTMMTFTSYAVENQSNPSDEQIGNEAIKFSRVRCSLGVGMANMLSSKTSMFQSSDAHNAKLKKGITFDLGVSYFLYPKFGFGAKYKAFGAQDSPGTQSQHGEWTLNDLNERTVYNYIGVELLGRFFHEKRHNLIVSGSVGFLYLNDNSKFNVVEFPLHSTFSYFASGKTFAGAIDLGYDFKLHENIAIGINLSMVMGILTKWMEKTDKTMMSSVTEVDVKNGRNLSRVEFTIGIRFLTKKK